LVADWFGVNPKAIVGEWPALPLFAS